MGETGRWGEQHPYALAPQCMQTKLYADLEVNLMDLLKSNVGKVDRIVRLVLGALLVGNVFYGLQSPAGWLGVILIVTALAGTCPVYSLLGLSTKSLGEKVGLK